MKEKIKEKLELVKEAIKDWENKKLSDISALIAIRLIINNQEPSKEMIEWAIKSIKKHMENNNE